MKNLKNMYFFWKLKRGFILKKIVPSFQILCEFIIWGLNQSPSEDSLPICAVLEDKTTVSQK